MNRKCPHCGALKCTPQRKEQWEYVCAGTVNGQTCNERQKVDVGTDPIVCVRCGQTCRIAWEVKA